MLRQKSGTQKIRLFSFAAGFLLITLGALSVPFSYAKENTEITRPDETALYAEILSSFHGCRDALLKRIAGEKKKDKEIYAKAELLEYQFSKADGSFEKAFIFLEGLKTDAENSFANGTASEKLFALERIIAAFSDGAYSSVTVNEAAEKAFSFIPEQEKKDNGEENEKTGKNGFFKAFPEKELKQKAKKALGCEHLPPERNGIFRGEKTSSFDSENAYAELDCINGGLIRTARFRSDPSFCENGNVSGAAYECLFGMNGTCSDFDLVSLENGGRTVYFVFCPAYRSGGDRITDFSSPVIIGIDPSDCSRALYDPTGLSPSKEPPDLSGIKKAAKEYASETKPSFGISKDGVFAYTRYVADGINCCLLIYPDGRTERVPEELFLKKTGARR